MKENGTATNKTENKKNSSSSSFIVRVGIRLKDGRELKYEAFSEDDDSAAGKNG